MIAGIQTHAQSTSVRLADVHGPGQRALFRVHDCMQRGTKRLSLRQSAGPLMLAPPVSSSSQTDTQALTISRQSTQSAACYQLSNWISGTNVITAGVFIYIIIITALPRGATGERQGLGRDEGWDRGGGGGRGGGRGEAAGRVKSLPVEKERWTNRRRRRKVRSRFITDTKMCPTSQQLKGSVCFYFLNSI